MLPSLLATAGVKSLLSTARQRYKRALGTRSGARWILGTCTPAREVDAQQHGNRARWTRERCSGAARCHHPLRPRLPRRAPVAAAAGETAPSRPSPHTRPAHTHATPHTHTRDATPTHTEHKMSIIIDDAGVNGADGKNVYVGNLSWETDDAQLLELVSQYGTVTSAHVETSKSGRSLGYGLVAYASEADASYAIEQLDELEFGGRKIRVRVDRGPTAPKAKKERAPREQRPRRERVPDEDKVVEPTKVFVMNLNFDTTEDELADHCASYGSVVAAELLTRGRNNRPSGSAIVEYSGGPRGQGGHRRVGRPGARRPPAARARVLLRLSVGERRGSGPPCRGPVRKRDMRFTIRRDGFFGLCLAAAACAAAFARLLVSYRTLAAAGLWRARWLPYRCLFEYTFGSRRSPLLPFDHSAPREQRWRAVGACTAERVSSFKLSEPHRSTPRLTAAEKMRRSTAAARTVLCGTVIRCARALSAAPMETIQRCMLRRAEQRGGPVPLVTRKVQESITRRRRTARARRPCWYRSLP